MIETEKPPLDSVYLEHYGVKGMHWGKRKNDALTNTHKIKASAAVGAAAVGSILYATGTLKPTSSAVGRAALFGASKTGGLLVKVGAIVGTAVMNGAITVVGTPYNMLT